MSKLFKKRRYLFDFSLMVGWLVNSMIFGTKLKGEIKLDGETKDYNTRKQTYLKNN